MNDTIANITAAGVNESLTVASHTVKNISIEIINQSAGLVTSIAQEATSVDPNWFYSTAAQSAAAIIGLMGAFLTTKLINEKSAIAEAERLIEELSLQIDAIRLEIEPKQQWVASFEQQRKEDLVVDFLRNYQDKLDTANPPSLDELHSTAIQSEEYAELDKPILGEKYDDKYIADCKASQKAHKFGFTQIIMPRNVNWLKYNDYRDEIHAKMTEIQLDENLVSGKHQEMRRSIKEIKEIKKNLKFLFAFSITGLFLPLVMMLFDYDTMTKWRVATCVIILLGWLTVIVPLYVEIRNVISSKTGHHKEKKESHGRPLRLRSRVRR